MKHGDLGVDNFKPYTDGQKDAGHKHYIESGAHMMLMPKDRLHLMDKPQTILPELHM